MTRQLVGVLGGTFDPVHNGHVQLAQDAIAALGLDVLRCTPAGQPPHRQAPVASAADRLAMVQRAFVDEPRCLVDDAEVRQDGPSWTIRTLERLRHELPDAALVLLVGADAFMGLSTWHRWQSLIDYAHIAVANRPGSQRDAASMTPPLAALWQARQSESIQTLHNQPAGAIVSFNMTPSAVSATCVRQAIGRGEQIHDLVPPAVEKYIHEHHLYL